MFINRVIFVRVITVASALFPLFAGEVIDIPPQQVIPNEHTHVTVLSVVVVLVHRRIMEWVLKSLWSSVSSCW